MAIAEHIPTNTIARTTDTAELTHNDSAKLSQMSVMIKSIEKTSLAFCHQMCFSAKITSNQAMVYGR